MNAGLEVQRLTTQLAHLRECVKGATFEGAREAYLDIEATKIRINIARNPNHYEEAHAAFDEDRRVRRLRRRAA
jgi:hypothetical protein